jgi:serine/threonine-protein kinase
VAIKLLHSAVAAKASVVQRFEREAQAAGRIGSEHIVEVLDLGTSADGERYMVMEFLEGESLGERLRRKDRLAPGEIAGVLCQLLAGLAAAHGAGIIHRDLKPDNVFLLHSRGGQRDFVKILDFGVSKFTSLEPELSMTKTGAVVGTPFYMSPEQARGQDVDPRSDLYSVGVVAYQAVTGRVPFQAATFNELVFKIALESPEPADLVVPELDAGFAALITRSMLRDPAARFQTAAEFEAAVAAWAASAGVKLERTGAILPTGIAGAMGGSSAVELGLAKTVNGESTSSGAAAGRARGRRALTGAAVVLALALGGLGAYLLVGGARGSHAPAAGTAAAVATTQPTATETAAPAPSATPATTPTAAPSVTATGEPAAPQGGHVAKPRASATPRPAARPAAPPPTPAGRTIGSEL